MQYTGVLGSSKRPDRRHRSLPVYCAILAEISLRADDLLFEKLKHRHRLTRGTGEVAEMETSLPTTRSLHELLHSRRDMILRSHARRSDS